MIGGAFLVIAAMTTAITYFLTRDNRAVPTTPPTGQPQIGAPPLTQTPCTSPPLLQAESVHTLPFLVQLLHSAIVIATPSAEEVRA